MQANFVGSRPHTETQSHFLSTTSNSFQRRKILLDLFWDHRRFGSAVQFSSQSFFVPLDMCLFQTRLFLFPFIYLFFGDPFHWNSYDCHFSKFLFDQTDNKIPEWLHNAVKLGFDLLPWKQLAFVVHKECAHPCPFADHDNCHPDLHILV